MKRLLRNTYNAMVMFGIDPRKMVYALRGIPGYFRDLWLLRRQQQSAAAEFAFGRLYPCLNDRFAKSGSATGHYFHQDLLVARRIYVNRPDIHVDVGSRVDGFVAHVASFRSIEVIDIRPLSTRIANVKFMQADLMGTLDEHLVDYCDSLSCLHAMEHFGLGRYGDSVNYHGYLLGLDNLYRILKRGGKLYLSVPIGPQRIEFNAHRVFAIGYLLEQMKDRYRIDKFSFVDDNGELHEDAELTDSAATNNFGCAYGCGIFEMTKV